MILVDFYGVAYSSVFVDAKMSLEKIVNEEILLHVILRQLISYRKKFPDDGEIVLCLDNRSLVWRKQLFPYYKYGRKQGRISSGIDWDSVFSSINKITEAFKNCFPYKIVSVEGLEADDCIAILAKHFSERERIVIVSNDKDYGQLLRYDNICQYLPRTGSIRNVTKDVAKYELTELILKGDRADGIPNIRSELNTFYNEKKQNPLRRDIIKQVLMEGVDSLPEFERKRYEENETLISFDKIPSRYIPAVLESYEKKPNLQKLKMFEYLASRGMNDIITRDLNNIK